MTGMETRDPNVEPARVDCERIVPQGHDGRPIPALPRLSDAFPDEVDFFTRKFIWPSNRGGFYTRGGYFGTDKRRPWQPFKRFDGRWQHLYPKLVLDLAEKHLDFVRFCRTADRKSQVRPRDEQTGFWLGTMAGPRTWADCLDVDSHDGIGWYGLPTRWHACARPRSWRRSPSCPTVTTLPCCT
jgi:hypothetical protein